MPATRIREFLLEEEGATAVEYAVMLMLIVGTCIVAIQLVGTNAADLWGDNSTEIQSTLGDLD